MIAIVGSLVLVLYVFLPEFLFTTLAFNFRKINRVPVGRYSDILSGGAATLIPFLIASAASRCIWFVGHWPFPVQGGVDQKYADYRTVATALYSETWFREHLDASWQAWAHVRMYQERFLVWMYLGLFLQIACVILLTRYFGSLSRYAWYRKTLGRLFLRRASHWEVLLTGFVFPPGHRPKVGVDAITTDSHLYAGTVADFFLRVDGELSGLLLTDIKRFKFNKLEEDRKAGLDPDGRDYWKPIPGANFYLPADKIANLNIRYESPLQDLVQDVQDWVNSLNPGGSIVVTVEATHESEPPPAAEGNNPPEPPDEGVAS